MRHRPWVVAVLAGVLSAGWGAMRAQDKTGEPGRVAGPELIHWVPISSGTFSMGADGAGLDEQPVHRVTIPAFEIARTPVTFKQYSACVAAGGQASLGGGVGIRGPQRRAETGIPMGR